MHSKESVLKNSSRFVWGDHMKKSESELALEELFASDQQSFSPMADNTHLKNSQQLSSITSLSEEPFYSMMINSPPSICSDSPTSDEECVEIIEQTNDPIDVKHIKRKVSNRESARRSRRRKQAHLSDLEQQVEELKGENATLSEQLGDACEQFKDAATNNRLLKSDVGALRAKVKLGGDLLSHLLQNYLNTPDQMW